MERPHRRRRGARGGAKSLRTARAVCSQQVGRAASARLGGAFGGRALCGSRAPRAAEGRTLSQPPRRHSERRT
eukprot:595242-Prymnesium_polylepis.1